MNIIFSIILCAIFADFILQMIADIFNLRMLKNQLPEQFKGWYDDQRYASSQKYLRVNTRFEWLVSTVSLVLFLGLWFAKGFPLIDQWVRSISHSPVICGMLYIGILFILKSFISLPFSIYSTFCIEDRFGFNKTTWKIFISDRCKQFVLAVLLGGILLCGVLAFFEYGGPYAWFYCWIVIVVFMVVMQFVVPTWIMPIFNKFNPLDPGELKSAIMAYADSINFSLKNVFIMDGSKRSKKTNAFFTGFGRHKRIVLYDTLVENHTTYELVAVLAHEMGHYKKKHVLWMLLTGILQTGIMLFLLSLFIASPMLFDAFYMDKPSVYAGLVFFGILYAPIDFFMGILMQFFSRRNEYAADRFAVETTRDSESFVSALKKLAVHNLSNLMPHPLYVVLNYSHPPVLERLEAIGKVKGL
ncbi:MAG: M48 family metallopeptidase [Desulfobacteraceae bacterium]|nr:M48 family metallopeptidase [Desulfobacteraceae bacterium]MBC2754524.1 M48 family metallopeptidase [Desulfobacteraceae bacterium]